MGRRHSDLVKRPEMRALVGLFVVFVDQVGLKASGRGNEIIGKRETRPLSSESTGEVSYLDVFLPARSTCPPCDQSLFDGYDAV